MIHQDEKRAAGAGKGITRDGLPRWDYLASGEQLTAGLERRLSEQVQRGDRTAYERMVNANVPLVVSIARQYGSSHLEAEDLIQEGMIGLCVAVERYDPARGFRFSTYATYWIKQRVLRALDRQSRLIRLPVDVGGAARKAEALREKLAIDLGREPTIEELATACGISARRLEAVLECLAEPLSLDAPVADDADPLTLDVPDPRCLAPDAELLQLEEYAELDELLQTLPPRDRMVLEARFGLGGRVIPLADLAERLRITREGVRQVQRRALLKLRKRFAEIHPLAA
jgi:RNA polymerase primary sigma factor